MTPRTYSSAATFKQALEQRLRASSTDGKGLVRRRQLLAFGRFLARAVSALGEAFVLKGGLVLELRLERSRTTIDVDLRMVGSPEGLLGRLQRAGRLDLGDFMIFEVIADEDHPTIRNDGMQYDGFRFLARCALAGKLYGEPFGVDVAFGEPMFGEPDSVVAEDTLAFAGVAPPTLQIYPIETHIAEKLHAYTMPRIRPKSRVKDLPDLALLATAQPLSADRLRAALAQTFEFRKIHPVPGAVPTPPETWRKPYEDIVRSDRLPWTTLEEVTEAARSFLDPVLAGGLDAAWNPAEWRWLAQGQ